MIIIGEKLNGTIPSVARAIAARDGEWIKDVARRQAEAGADFIDLCASVEIGELETLHWMIDQVQSVTDVPICIDSPSTEILAQAYPFCRRPGLFNSVSMESKKQIDHIFRIMADNPGWEVIAMLCDDSGIPKSAADRLRVFENIMKKAADYGIDPARIHIDPVIEAAALMDPDQADGPGIAINTKVIGTIRAQYPTIHITSAISNISHGLPARKYMNYSFAVLALAYGLDSGILDPLNQGMKAVLESTEKLLKLPEPEFAELVQAAAEGRLDGCVFPAADGRDAEQSRKYMSLCMTVLAMNAGAREIEPDESDPDAAGMAYAAQALLGMDEDGYCIEYIEAYKDGVFGAPGK